MNILKLKMCFDIFLLGCIPKLKDVFQLYCSLEPGLTIKDLCYRHEPSRLGIDERFAKSFVVC